MKFAADFTAIDFETANHRRDSACQLAAVVVRDGQIVDQAMWMIRPEPLQFSRGNIQIHGITPARVRGECVFGDLWDQIGKKLGNDCLVAHNASFDIGVLLACLKTHCRPAPDMHFTCTRAVARRTWPHRPGFGLKPLADWLGIRFQHHDALEDSIACAKILLTAGIDREAESLEDLEAKLQISRGRAGQWGYRSPSARSRGRATAARPRQPHHLPPSREEIDLQRLMVRADFIRPLLGKRIVFHGRLRGLSPEQALQLAARFGGTCQSTMDASVDVVVLGGLGYSAAEDLPGLSPEAVTAGRMQVEGKLIRVIDEQEFLQLVVSPLSDA